MDKITIELDREDALLLREVLGRANYYFIGALLCNMVTDANVTENDVTRHDIAINHAYVALQNALGE